MVALRGVRLPSSGEKPEGEEPEQDRGLGQAGADQRTGKSLGNRLLDRNWRGPKLTNARARHRGLLK